MTKVGHLIVALIILALAVKFLGMIGEGIATKEEVAIDFLGSISQMSNTLFIGILILIFVLLIFYVNEKHRERSLKAFGKVAKE